MRTVSCGVIAALLVLIGCTKEATGNTSPSADADSPASASTPAAKDDACALLSLAEIRRVLPDAAKVVRNDHLAAQGIAGCGWYAASGKAPRLEVSVWEVSGADDTVMENARTLAMGFADPLRGDAQQAVRLDKVAGVGEEAVVIVEKSDAARGILTTGAVLTLRQNGRIAMVTSGYMGSGDRSAALKDLAMLGKALAARL